MDDWGVEVGVENREQVGDVEGEAEEDDVAG